jgi:hypothetical protein
MLKNKLKKEKLNTIHSTEAKLISATPNNYDQRIAPMKHHIIKHNAFD